jgi:putative hemolysin
VSGQFPAQEALDGLPPSPRFSYASDELSRLNQQVVQVIERCTGQPRIRRMYEDYTKRQRPPELFWQDAIAALRLDLRLSRSPATAIPATGPLVIVANHPFGVVDGIILCWMVAQVRPDYQIMTHRILYQAPEVRRYILPVDFSGTDEATRNNLTSRRQARDLLASGGALIVFPGGGVATARPFWRRVVDRPWGPLTAKLALTTGADVLPVFVHGQNSRLFQAAASLHQVLKYSFLFHEVRNKIGARITASLGDAIPNASLQALGELHAVTAYLRQTTHALADR